MPFVHEEEEVLVRIKALRYQDIAYERERIIGGSDLDRVVRTDVLDYLFFAVHVPMDTQEFWVRCRLVLDQTSEGHGKDGITGLLNGQRRGTTSGDALVENAVDWDL